MGRGRYAIAIAVAATLIIPLLASTVSRAVQKTSGQNGQFNAECQFSHRGPDDPIVFPGESGKSHSHDFIANTSTNASSSFESLKASATTCKRAADRSAYWFPTLYENGVPVTPADATVYYRTSRREPGTIRPFPQGLEVIAGDSKHQTIQPNEVIHWGCHPELPLARQQQPPSGSPHALAVAEALQKDQAQLGPALRAVKRAQKRLRRAKLRLRRGTATRRERRVVRRRRAALKRNRLAYRELVRSIDRNQAELDRIVKSSNVAVPTCPAGSLLEVIIFFPDCWDGTNLDSSDHKSHMAYSEWSREAGYRVCSRSHPVPMPKLAVTVRYPTDGGSDVTLSSGLGYTAHADFVNAWDEATLAQLVNDCLNADAYCGKGSKPGPNQPRQTPAPNPAPRPRPDPKPQPKPDPKPQPKPDPKPNPPPDDGPLPLPLP